MEEKLRGRAAVLAIANLLSTALKPLGFLSNSVLFHLPAFEIRRAKRITESPSRFVPELDGIRGYASLSVLLLHCLICIMHPPGGSVFLAISNYTLGLTSSGVDLFFVLSGFLIGGILMDTRRDPKYFKRFWIRRVARIFPVLWMLLASYAVAMQLRAHFDLKWMDLWLLQDPKPPFWSFATFTQNIAFAMSAGNDTHGPRWVGVTWSLACEEQFYSFFPVLVYFLSRRSLALTALAGIVAAPILRVLFAIAFGNWFAPYVLLPSRLDGLMFGVIVAMIIRNKRALLASIRLRRILDVIALTIIYLIVSHNNILNIWRVEACGPFPPLKFSIVSVLCAILILRVFLYQNDSVNNFWRSKPMMSLGIISYGLYMYHMPINGLVHGFIFQQEPRVDTFQEFLASLLVMVSAMLVATVSYIFVEKPIRIVGRRLSGSAKSAAGQVLEIKT